MGLCISFTRAPYDWGWAAWHNTYMEVSSASNAVYTLQALYRPQVEAGEKTENDNDSDDMAPQKAPQPGPQPKAAGQSVNYLA